jgi:small Trp-rich protein
MWFVVIGCLLLAMKVGDVQLAAALSWWIILTPFGLAVVWWSFADSMGLTQAREIRKMEDRKVERRRRAMDALGLNWRRDKRVAVIKEQRRVEPVKDEPPKRSDQERHNRDVITAFLPSRQELPPQRKGDGQAG